MSQIKKVLQNYRNDLAKLETEFADVQKEYEQKKGQLLFAIQGLETALKEPSKKRGRLKTGTSVANLAEKILENRTDGMSVPALVTELKKLGWLTLAEDPVNTVNSLLHRAKDEGKPFKRLEDGRWILEKQIGFKRVPKLAQEPEIELSDFATLLLDLLSDGQGHSEEDLARLAREKGWAGSPHPKASVHGGLMNAAKRKMVEFRQGMWFKVTPPKEVLSNGHELNA